jgi:AraC-like DNA-binding protein
VDTIFTLECLGYNIVCVPKRLFMERGKPMSSAKEPNPKPPCHPTALSLIREHSLRIAPLLGLPRILADYGLDADAVIHEAGCDPELFKDPENTIEFAVMGHLLAHAAVVTGNPYLGLEIGRQLGLDVLGQLGHMLRFSADVGTALRTLILHFHLHDRGAIPSLWETESQAMFGYTVYCPDVPGIDLIYDGALAIAINFMRELVGKGWQATEIRLFRDRPLDTKPFRDHFRTRLRFRAERAVVVFPIADLARPLPDADPIAYHRAHHELEAMDTSGDNALLKNQILRVLHRLFISGACPEGVELQRIARLFSLHPRTFSRRLRAEGTNYNELLNTTRYAVARQLLRDTQLQITELSIALGYADSAAFDHAFKRWSGTTASKWRSRQKS